jgi:TDG/mug DNA glycosylase family protein
VTFLAAQRTLAVDLGQPQETAVLPDVIAKNLSILFCGLNPGNQAAATGYHFIGRSNRFWRALHLAGFTPQQIRAEDGHSLLGYGCGLTTVVERATAGADELARHEFILAQTAFEKKIAHYRPRCVAFLGKAAYAAMLRQRDVAWGQQPARFGDALAWILPNPSGRNRAFGLDELVVAYRALRLEMAKRQ